MTAAMLKRDVWRVREGAASSGCGRTVCSIYMFIYMDSFTIYKVSTSTNLHGGPVADGHVVLETSSQRGATDTQRGRDEEERGNWRKYSKQMVEEGIQIPDDGESCQIITEYKNMISFGRECFPAPSCPHVLLF